MIFNTKAQKPRPLVSLTPLIDVVFILLIFFMLSSSFMRWYALDIASSTSATQGLNSNSQAIIVVIEGSNSYSISGTTYELGELISHIRVNYASTNDVVRLLPTDSINVQTLVDTVIPIKSIIGPRLHVISGVK